VKVGVLLIALAGGAGPGDEDVLGCCGMCPVLPLAILLAGWAVYRKIAWPACLALLLSGLPYLYLHSKVAGYQPSDDWEIMGEQATGRKFVWFYGLVAGAAGLALLCVYCRKLVGWGGSAETVAPPGRGGPST
jgi:hypothetical protein